MKHVFSKRTLSILLSLIMLLSLMPVAMLTASADTVISYPIIVNGDALVGDIAPYPIANLPNGDNYYFCDGSCGIDEHYISNRWFNKDGSDATEFVNGNKYFYQAPCLA